MGELSNFNIMDYFEENKNKNFGGIYAKDELPHIKIKKKFYIINLDDDDGPGTHWVLASNMDDKYVIYVDSYGAPAPNEALAFMKSAKNKKIIYNTSQIQEIGSAVCGYYCLFFAEQLPEHNIVDLLYFFGNNTAENDKELLKYFKNKNIIQ